MLALCDLPRRRQIAAPGANGCVFKVASGVIACKQSTPEAESNGPSGP